MSDVERPGMPHSCEICGDKTEVSYGLVRWINPLPGELFGSAWRCKDRAACRVRCEALGDLWPIDDATVPGQIAVFDE